MKHPKPIEELRGNLDGTRQGGHTYFEAAIEFLFLAWIPSAQIRPFFINQKYANRECNIIVVCIDNDYDLCKETNKIISPSEQYLNWKIEPIPAVILISQAKLIESIVSKFNLASQRTTQYSDGINISVRNQEDPVSAEIKIIRKDNWGLKLPLRLLSVLYRVHPQCASKGHQVSSTNTLATALTPFELPTSDTHA